MPKPEKWPDAEFGKILGYQCICLSVCLSVDPGIRPINMAGYRGLSVHLFFCVLLQDYAHYLQSRQKFRLVSTLDLFLFAKNVPNF